MNGDPLPFIDAALIGDKFHVTTDELKLTKPTAVVRIAVHGDRFLLHPDEARRLAVALIETAAAAERETLEPSWP